MRSVGLRLATRVVVASVVSLGMVSAAHACPYASRYASEGLAATPAALSEPILVHFIDGRELPPNATLRAASDIDRDATIVEDSAPDEIAIFYGDADELSARAWTRSLATWLLAVLAIGLLGAILARIGAARRPLQTNAYQMHSNLFLITLLLSGPMLPQLVLLHAMHAERAVISALVVALALTGVGIAFFMLLSRRRLQAQLRWAQVGSLDSIPDGAWIAAEVEPRNLCNPVGDGGPTPWFLSDLSVTSQAGPARISLAGITVDDEVARTLMGLAVGKQAPRTAFTVLGQAMRVPADVADAPALCRDAATQARITGGQSGSALLCAGSLAELASRLRTEMALITGTMTVLLGFAAVSLLF